MKQCLRRFQQVLDMALTERYASHLWLAHTKKHTHTCLDCT